MPKIKVLSLVMIAVISLVGCGGGHIGENKVHGLSRFEWAILTDAYQKAQIRDANCNQNGAIITGHDNGFFPGPICATNRLYQDLIYYYPSLSPVTGETVASGLQIVCQVYNTSTPVINPANNDWGYLAGATWSRSAYLNPPNKYEPAIFFHQEYIFDNSNNITGLYIYTTVTSDNYIVCSSSGINNYRIIQVL